jgi:hypothetical protein
MRKMSVLAVALLLAACGTDAGSHGSSKAEAPAGAPPRCADVFKAGQVPTGLDDVSPACLDSKGTSVILASWRCRDSSHLVMVEKTSEAPQGWYFTGKKYQATAGEVSADPGYSAAYDKCLG